MYIQKVHIPSKSFYSILYPRFYVVMIEWLSAGSIPYQDDSQGFLVRRSNVLELKLLFELHLLCLHCMVVPFFESFTDLISESTLFNHYSILASLHHINSCGPRTSFSSFPSSSPLHLPQMISNVNPKGSTTRSAVDVWIY